MHRFSARIQTPMMDEGSPEGEHHMDKRKSSVNKEVETEKPSEIDDEFLSQILENQMALDSTRQIQEILTRNSVYSSRKT